MEIGEILFYSLVCRDCLFHLAFSVLYCLFQVINFPQLRTSLRLELRLLQVADNPPFGIVYLDKCKFRKGIPHLLFHTVRLS